jgi:hypothetical protein
MGGDIIRRAMTRLCSGRTIAMYIDNDEAAYLITRIRVSQEMAAAAAGPCARHAHSELASCYQDKLAALLRTIPQQGSVVEIDYAPFAAMDFLHRSAASIRG